MSESTHTTPLVLLHGWGVHSKIWQPLMASLQEHFEVHLLDLPGYGADHQYCGVYSLEATANRLLDQAPEQAIWVAWSLGGTIALHAALTSPHRFLGLQLVSVTPRFRGDSNWQFGVHPAAIESLIGRFLFSYPDGLKRFLMMQSTDRRLVRSVYESLAAMESPADEILEASLQLLVETDLRDRSGFQNLARDSNPLSMPTQVVYGNSDLIVAPEASQFLDRQLGAMHPLHQPACELDGGHLCFLESQTLFLQNLMRFAEVCVR